MINMQRLDQLALDIEFLLISVIQGVALATLAAAAVVPLTTLQFAVWPYIAAAFLFILIFWSGAIIHAVSFIDWPIDLVHSFIYFLASIVEILAITSLSDSQRWFVFLFIFLQIRKKRNFGNFLTRINFYGNDSYYCE